MGKTSSHLPASNLRHATIINKSDSNELTPERPTSTSQFARRPEFSSDSYQHHSDLTSADEDGDHEHLLSGTEGLDPNPFFFGQPNAKLEPYQMRLNTIIKFKHLGS